MVQIFNTETVLYNKWQNSVPKPENLVTDVLSIESAQVGLFICLQKDQQVSVTIRARQKMTSSVEDLVSDLMILLISGAHC